MAQPMVRIPQTSAICVIQALTRQAVVALFHQTVCSAAQASIRNSPGPPRLSLAVLVLQALISQFLVPAGLQRAWNVVLAHSLQRLLPALQTLASLVLLVPIQQLLV